MFGAAYSYKCVCVCGLLNCWLILGSYYGQSNLE